jgi:serine/threonine protein kinase
LIFTLVDIWACGVVLYNMLSGNLPFEFNEDANLIDLHDKIVIGKYEMPEEATLGSEDLIESIIIV